MSERKKYPSDLTDNQWHEVESYLQRTTNNGHPTLVNLREILNAIIYKCKTGVQWSYLPHDFPPYRTVYYYFEKWSKEGIFEKIHHVVSIKARQFDERESNPSTVIVDSQSIKSSYQKNFIGFDSNKKIKGRKRHIAIDTLGILIAVIVTAANVHDSTQFTNLFAQAAQNNRTNRIERVYADSAYDNQYNRDFLQKHFQSELISSKKPHQTSDFIPILQRWKVERTISWFGGYRNLSRDYESSIQSSEAWVWIAASHHALQRLSQPHLAAPQAAS